LNYSSASRQSAAFSIPVKIIRLSAESRHETHQDAQAQLDLFHNCHNLTA